MWFHMHIVVGFNTSGGFCGLLIVCNRKGCVDRSAGDPKVFCCGRVLVEARSLKIWKLGVCRWIYGSSGVVTMICFWLSGCRAC